MTVRELVGLLDDLVTENPKLASMPVMREGNIDLIEVKELVVVDKFWHMVDELPTERLVIY